MTVSPDDYETSLGVMQSDIENRITGNPREQRQVRSTRRVFVNGNVEFLLQTRAMPFKASVEKDKTYDEYVKKLVNSSNKLIPRQRTRTRVQRKKDEVEQLIEI